MQDMPKHFRAQFNDRFANFIRGIGVMMLQMELEFNSHLDIDRLSKALDLTLDAEPVLGCRFVTRWWRPYWERLDAGSRDVLAIAEDTRAYEDFKRAIINPYIGPQIKACLLRTPDRDHLLIKVAHEVSDVSGVKQIVGTISSTYSMLAHDPAYRPEPNIYGDRSIWQVLRHVPWHAYPNILYDYYAVYTIPGLFPVVSIHLPVVADDDRTLEYISRTIHEDFLKKIIEYGRQRNATLNDVLEAAFFHAIAATSDWDHKSQLRVRITIDLRRFIPGNNAGGMCNLGGMEIINLGTDLNDDFDYTLKRISSFMKQRKARWMGIHDYLGFAPLTTFFPHSVMKNILVRIIQSGMKIGNDALVVANMGAIEQKAVTFDIAPIKARFLGTVDYPPHICFWFDSYNGVLNIAAGSWPCSKKQIERCLDEVIILLNALSSERAKDTQSVA
jgi:NRPS condensation-like uncharacterized protein